MLLESSTAIQIYKGQSKNLRLFVLDKKTRQPVDLTGASIYLTVKSKVASADVILRKTSADILEINIDQPLAGQALIYFTPVDTLNLECRGYVFDVWVVLNTGARHLVVTPSEFIVKATVGVLPI